MSLDKNPIATKAVTSAVLTLAGDLICQVHLQRLASRLMQCNAAWIP
jgi:peroxisomal membrane protein 2